ncbi:LPXTG cell wall anchor domain-containing protein [Candidatus Amarolinea aalborgensis]
MNGFTPQAGVPTGWLLAAGLIALVALAGAAVVWRRRMGAA